MSNTYDFIVVGAGAAGCPIAARLAESKKKPKILLLEAGMAKDDANDNFLHNRFTASMSSPNSTAVFQTQKQKNCNDRVIAYPRGKALGGSTAINISTYTVGPRDDYDRWAHEVSDSSFGWANSVRIRQRIERYDIELSNAQSQVAEPDMSIHGTNGPVHVEYPLVVEAILSEHLNAAKESGLGITKDPNDGNPLGLASTPSSARKGIRVNAATAYLSSIPPNLEVATDKYVSQILFDGKTAIGVVANGQRYLASQEVIVCAGAVETPKVLMLSGIGDSDELRKLGIESICHLPGVGRNLQDHYFTVMAWELKEDRLGWTDFFTDAEKVRKAREQFAHRGTGPYSVFNCGLSVGFFKADEVQSTTEFNNLQSHIQQHIRKPTVPLWEISTLVPPLTRRLDYHKPYLTVGVFLHNPQSVGTIRLSSSEPGAPPLIDPEYLSHPFDRVCAVAATRATMDFVENSPRLNDNILVAADAPASRTDEDILAYWRAAGSTSWHPSCTVKMGASGAADACVDSSFKVMGLEKLRVADLSVTPFLPSCHPQSVAYFIGELAAEKMIEEHGLN